MELVYASNNFLYVDIGVAGHASDTGVCSQSLLKKSVASNRQVHG